MNNYINKISRLQIEQNNYLSGPQVNKFVYMNNQKWMPIKTHIILLKLKKSLHAAFSAKFAIFLHRVLKINRLGLLSNIHNTLYEYLFF